MNNLDLAHIATSTIGHYEAQAAAYRAGTQDHDVSQNIDALLNAIASPPPFTLLDLGCGPGRDLVAFSGRGHHAVGLDGSAQFVAMARAHSGCEVLQQDLLELALPAAHFDGVFANAVLFHVPAVALPQVLREIHACLKPDGVLFSSNPLGHDEAGWHGARYGVYHSWPSWRQYLDAAGFAEVTHYYRPADAPRWLASVWRRRSVNSLR